MHHHHTLSYRFQPHPDVVAAKKRRQALLSKVGALSIALALSLLASSSTVSYAAAASTLAKTNTTSKATTPEAPTFKTLHLVAPSLQVIAPNLVMEFTQAQQVNDFNKVDAQNWKFTSNVPQLITVPNEDDGYQIEVAIYKPQLCLEDSPTCPVWTEFAPLFNPSLNAAAGNTAAGNGTNSYSAATPAHAISGTTSTIAVGNAATGSTTTATATAVSSSYPLVLFSYGGGFLFRNLYYASPYYQKLSNTLQMTVAVPRYRITSEKPFPAPLLDNYSALGFLLAHQNDYGIDGSKVFLMGASAGGGLSASLALYNRDHAQYL